MPRINGIFQLVASYLAVPGQTIRTEQHNPPLEDIAQGLTDSLPRDGTAGMTANLPMGGNRITGMAAGTTNGDAVRYEQVVRTSGDQTVGGNKTFSDNVTVSGTFTASADNLSGTLPAGVLPNHSAVLLTSGTVAGARLGGNQTMAGNKTFSGNVTVSGTFTASADNLSGTLPAATLPFSNNGLLVRTAAATYASRSITGGDGITVSNGNGVSGNPTAAVDNTVLRTNSAQTITANKTFSSASSTLVFDADGNARNTISFNRGGGADVWLRHEANGDLNIITNTGRSVKVDGSNVVTQSDVATVAEARAGSANDKMMTPLRVAQAVLGINQSWVDVLSNRSVNTVYQNTTGRPIQVSIASYNSIYQISTTGSGGWVTIGQSEGNRDSWQSPGFVVPNGHYYRVNLKSGSADIDHWSELR